jgi:hypothetical protein
MKSGKYRVELHETWGNTVIETNTYHTNGGSLRITLPPLERDIAIKATRISDDES